ncbi:MAG: hypothetical protein WC645_03015 [Candidatus Margulisiibacteriota bacterium]
MPEVMSFRPLNDPAANWSNRLMCAAKLALARTSQPENLRRKRAIEILETAPENRFIERQFDAVYRQLIPLYVASNYFEEALLHPGFSRKHLETFKTAFERFNILFNVPYSRTVSFYLGAINLAQGEGEKARREFIEYARSLRKENPWNVTLPDVLRCLKDGQEGIAAELLGPNFERLERVARQEPLVRPEIEDFLRYCREQTCQKAVGRFRGRLLMSWIRNEIPAPDLHFSYPVGRRKYFNDVIMLFRTGGRAVELMGLEIDDTDAKVRTEEKAGEKVVNIFSSKGAFVGKGRVHQRPDGNFEAEPITLSPNHLMHERTHVLLDWLENRGEPPPFLFEYKSSGAGVVTLFQIEKKRTLILGLPKNEHLAFQFINRGREKIVSIYSISNLSQPICEHRFYKDSGDRYKTEPLELSHHQSILRNSDQVRDWLSDNIQDPETTFKYYVLRSGAFTLAVVGGKPILLTPLRPFFLAMPFMKSEIVGLEDWFVPSRNDPDLYQFKRGIHPSQIKRTKNRRLILLWRKASEVLVRLKTINDEKHAIVSQEGNPLPHRYFRLVLQSNGTYRVEIRNPTRAQKRLKETAPVRNFLAHNGPSPEGLFPYVVRWNGQIDLIRMTKQVIVLHGLGVVLGIKDIHEKEAVDLAKRFPDIILERGGKYRFSSHVYETQIRNTQDRELIELWNKTHRAMLSFREENEKGLARKIVEVHHARTRKLVAEIELELDPDGYYRLKRLDLSPHQALNERGMRFFNWINQSDTPLMGPFEYPHTKGEIILFKYGSRSLRINIGMYRIPPIKFHVSGREDNSHKYIDVAYYYKSRNYLRTFEVWGNKEAGWRTEETPESRAIIDALPDDLRRLFTREKRIDLPADG